MYYFVAIVNEIVFLIAFPTSFLWVYRNAITFVCQFLPATLLNSFITPKSFFVELLGFSIYKIMSSASRDNLILPFQFGCPLFFFFSCIIVLSRTFSTKLNNNGESEHPCLVPDIRGKLYTFPCSV